MSDERTRELERAVERGEPGAAEALARARCRVSPRSGELLYMGTSGRFHPPPPASPIGFALAATGEDPVVSIQLPNEGPVVSLAREREARHPRRRPRRGR